jgi:GTP cyclohydrolase IA
MTLHHEHKIFSETDIIENAVEQIIKALGEDNSRAGLKDTPKRVAKAFIEMTSGHKMTPADIVGNALFPCDSKGPIVIKDMEFYSLCEHHLLPFFGKIHIAYIPDKKIIGLSKIGRLIDVLAKRLQVQENLTHQIKMALETLIKPQGVAVVVDAHHFCMMMRGVKKQGAITTTWEYSGVFQDNDALRSDFLHAIK